VTFTNREDATVDSAASLTTWLDELKLGNQQAAEMLWQAYYPRLVRLARRKLTGAARRVADEEDVMLAAFDSFCRGVKENRFPDLASRDDLWQILVVLTARKAVDQRQRERRQKRGGGRVRGESIFNRSAHSAGGLGEVIGREPTPEFAALVTEQVERLLLRLDGEGLRDLALLKLEGYTNSEIAERLNCGMRTIERKLSRIRAILRTDHGS
jgi:DNA-directed RNA polymerase specialized sigma24 family protein